MKNSEIDHGKEFDFGKTSKDYARYRDIYPPEFYEKLLDYNIGTKGQRILDLGTGTGVLPRNLYAFEAHWTASDISKNQIEEARKLSEGKEIDYLVSSTEDLSFMSNSFDVITACQCYWYFDHKRVAQNLYSILKEKGRLYFIYVAWLPYEDEIAKASEDLVLKYNPNWTGNGETMRPISIPEIYSNYFKVTKTEEFKIPIHFTRESWNGRMKSCRGIGASLSQEEIKNWEREHKELLERTTPEEFDILHYVAIAELTARNSEDLKSELMSV